MSESAFPLIELQDCHLITKTFEHGCHHSLTEESVFAPMSGHLSSMRSLSKSIGGIVTQTQSTSNENTNPNALTATGAALSTSEQPSISLNAVSSNNKSENILTNFGNHIISDVLPGGDSLGGIFNSKCIPCGFRINFKEELNIKASLEGLGAEMLAVFEKVLGDFLNQILQIIGMFKNLDKYIDLCAFLNFLKNFICIPDLQRILALLAAWLMKLALDLDLSANLVLSLVAPLFLPFFTNLMDILNKYLLMIIKPIDCIIDSIQNILTKLDYNVLFQNFQNVQISLGPKQGSPPNPTNPKVKIPFLGTTVTATGISENDPNGRNPDNRSRAFQFSLSAPFDIIAAKAQAKVEATSKDLEALKNSAGNVNAADPASIAAYKQKEKAAVAARDSAIKDRDLSAIGKVNKNIESFQQGFKGAFFNLVNILRQAAIYLDNFIRSLFEEFKKLLDELLGGTGTSFFNLSAKLEVLQLVGFIKALIDAFSKGIHCDEGKEVETFLSFLPKEKGFQVWTDDQGQVHIQEQDEDLSGAISALVKGNGTNPTTITDDSTGNKTRQKLNSLINFTGDPTLDSNIAKAVDGLSNAARATFKCPLQTTVSQTEQVNAWIQELST